MNYLANILRRPVRQAYAWAAVGVLGLAFAAGGVTLLTSGTDDGPARSSATVDGTGTPGSNSSSPSATASASPSSSPGASTTAATDTPTTTPTAVVTPTRTGVSQQNPSSGGTQPTAQPTSVLPTPAPTQPPAAARAYCGAVSSTAPPSSVFGLLTIGGQPGPVGTIATATFDGVTGPSQASTAAGGYRVDFPSGGDDCANRGGAAIAIVINGQPFSAGTAGATPANRLDIAIP